MTNIHTLEMSSKAHRVLHQRELASARGKATRAYLREHNELEKIFLSTGQLGELDKLPEHVTVASLVYEITDRLRRRERNVALREWRDTHPKEAEAIRKRIRGSNGA